jgi:membrane protease YdiL (CAAX protease family)
MATLLHAALALFLVLVFPVWDRYETRRLKASTDPRRRIRAYQITIAWQIVAVALLLATVPAALLFAPPAEVARLGIHPSPTIGIAIVVGLLAGAMLPVVLTRRDPKAREKLERQLDTIGFFLPRSDEERRWFAALSVVVGICEEIIFRGWLIRWLAGAPLGLGLIAAVVVAAAIFGIDHGYQGVAGIIATTVLALVFTILFFAMGTLWVPIAVHAVIDLRVLLLIPRTEPGLPGEG